nr:MAG: RNA-dependent RNA polymerase [Narnaviridae sp.]
MSQTQLPSGTGVALEYIEHFEAELARLGEGYSDGEPCLTDTAILMGDPGCKGVLTLHNLVAEEEAALEEQLGRAVRVQDLQEANPIHLPWRHFSCAGDDHTAIGPSKYLDNIGENHRKNQMVLSKDKHLRSLHGGFYCERVMFKGTDTVYVKLDGHTQYEQHILVDSVKVRLLSPETKDREAEVETNPAIGKARLLYKQLMWSPPGWERTLNVLVQRRFRGRMFKHLPRNRHGGLSRRIELPGLLGGIGMSPPRFAGWDLENVLAECSENHLRLVQHILKGIPTDTFGYRALAKYSSDRYARGVKLDDMVDLIVDRMFDLTPTYNHKVVIEEARTRFRLREGLGYRHIAKAVAKLGYETKQSFKRKLARAVNQEFLLVSNNSRGFKTATWEERSTSFEADVLIANVMNDVDPEYDMKFIYDKIMSFPHQEKLIRAIQEKEIYLDPTYEIELEDGTPFNILKDLKQNAPDTKLPPTRGFV